MPNPPPSNDPDVQQIRDISGTFEGIFKTYEVRILGVMGLMIGYISIFLTKILAFATIYAGVATISLITLLLLLIEDGFIWKDRQRWARIFLVIIICDFITAPQLYYAWTVSMNEVRTALREEHKILLEEKEKVAAPKIAITNQ